jgi:hypothetical protein
VESLECQARDAEVTVKIHSEADVDLEQWAAETAGELFKEVYGRRLVVARVRR